MKNLFIVLLALIVIPAVAFAAPAAIGFRNISAVGSYAATCSVFAGKQAIDGSFNAATVTSYSMSRAGTSSFNTVANTDYKISCFQTASPKDAVTVKIFFGTNETDFFPTSTLLLKRDY